MAPDFHAGANEIAREAELDDIKDQLTKPQDLKKAITDTVDPDGALSKSLALDEADEKKLGSVPVSNASTDDMENMTVDGDPAEAGKDHQFEILNQAPVDDDVMPINMASPNDKAESKS